MKRLFIYFSLIVLIIFILFFMPLKTIETEKISPDGNFKADIKLRYFNLSPDKIIIQIFELSDGKWNIIHSVKQKPISDPTATVGIDWIMNDNKLSEIEFYSHSSELKKSIELRFTINEKIPTSAWSLR